MPESYRIGLGGIPISLIPDQMTGNYELVKRAVDFYSPAVPEISLNIHCGWFPELRGEEVIFDSHQSWQLLRVDGKWGIKVRSPHQNPYQLGVFPPDFRSGDIYIAVNEATPDLFIFPLSYPMGELYMMNLLGTGVGMLSHATGVIDRGKGYLFTGNGGAGKTTIARLWERLRDVRVVNDDKIILRKEAGKFKLYGTPWHGDGGMALPDSAPLSRVFILKQANQNYSHTLHPAQAAAGLLTRAFIPLWDHDKITFTVKFLDELCQAIPCHELGFLPEPSIVDFVRNLA